MQKGRKASVEVVALLLFGATETNASSAREMPHLAALRYFDVFRYFILSPPTLPVSTRQFLIALQYLQSPGKYVACPTPYSLLHLGDFLATKNSLPSRSLPPPQDIFAARSRRPHRSRHQRLASSLLCH